ncbi:MAG: hypothetical protein JWN02_346, partial [Acidobacteria bacterium]|nr:hypothetical protein [Acidobacteriota bacterium]
QESGEGNFLQTRQQFFIDPQLYPGKELDPRIRLRAYAQLQQMRKARGIRHVSTGWLDPSGRQNGPGGGPGDGPGPGGPGTPGTTDVNGCAWTSVGPTNINGRVTNIAIDPTNHNRLFATSVGGIWRSTDGARRWQRVSDDFLATVFASVAINPGTPTEVFAGGGDPNYAGASPATGGIWRSTSSGDPATWSKVSPPELDSQLVYRLRIDPTAPNDVYAAASNGVWKGVHAGLNVTWTRVGAFDAWTSDMVVDFTASPRKIYAGVRGASGSFGRGIWKWDGLSWSERDTGIPTLNSRTVALAMSPSAPATLYAKIETDTGHLQGIYKTTTSAEAPGWTLLPAGAALDDSHAGSFFYSWYNSVLEADPTNANIVYGGGLSAFRTTNGGTNWDSVSGGADPAYPYWTHSDHHAFAFDPANPAIVYAGNDGGVDKSTDTSLATWHWTDASHGMVMTEFYRISSQSSTATLVTGGSQDNGTEISFGNRTWYNPGGCDGGDVAVDGQNPDTLYAFCNGGIFELANPVPGTVGGASQITWSSPAAPPIPPVITDASMNGRALAAGGAACDPKRVLKTVDGVNWTSASPTLAAGGAIRALGIAPSSGFQTYYVGMTYSPPSLTTCPGFAGVPFPATIWRTTNGGGAWNTTPTGFPDLWATNVTVDPANADRAFVTFSSGGGVYLTTNGTDWSSVSGTGLSALPNTAVWGIAIDPSDANTVYAATSIGVFKGTITPGAPPAGSWTPFDEGLPDGVTANGIWVNPATKVLTIGTMGHGSFQRDIRPGFTCPARMLVVRDNVYDRGITPSPSSVPDSEHPIPDASRPGFYKPDDTGGGKVYWWTSSDIRIDVPSDDLPKNTFSTVDNVELEICPTLIADCPAGTMVDSHARRGTAAKAYVQVANRGLQPVTQVRVIALYADATTGLPVLPADFWTTTFPAGVTTCGALDTSTGWHFVDSGSPCHTIPVVNPDLPEVARFNWSVPATAADHSCMLTIAESSQDPLDPSIRASNEVRPWVFVPNERHIGQRNLHVIDPTTPGGAPMMAEGMNVPNPMEKPGIELQISAVDLRAPLQIFLPIGASAEGRGVRKAQPKATDEQLRFLRAAKIDPTVAWEVTDPANATLLLPIPPHQTWKIGIVANGQGELNTSARISFVARQGNTILGGNSYLLRNVPKEAFAKGRLLLNPNVLNSNTVMP